MSAGLTIRPATIAEYQTAVDWAAAEGWNPGLDDLAAFYNADPEGFLMGWRDGAPVASSAVVRYGPEYGFLELLHRASGPAWHGRRHGDLECRDGASGRPDSWVGWRAGPTGELPEVRLRAGG